ncbi:hypothetical protein Bcoa_1840 [Heyndrickxia coagulans 36D1]|uniref:Uncharacterized protein n=1 Tax=Heyndrickxia coagulans 36D1 TaxID=345219 RepID=G2TK26_HEYCO|nr:hypothetical protein Bcoa_1840 [Heyndrickxia coagulans 36D1]KYC61336.1 hypothetical protein B4100_2003 [Heyndrickxia coagulans]
MLKKGSWDDFFITENIRIRKRQTFHFFPKELGLRLIQIAAVIPVGNIFGEEQKSF